MNLSRREFLQMLALAAASSVSGCARRTNRDLYDVEPFGNVTLFHITDTHAQLLPLYFREPSSNLGVAGARGKPPHLVGEALLAEYGVARGSRDAYALTYLDFEEAARRYGKVGGFAQLAALLKRLRAERPGRTLLLDGGDSWQGSATALWTKGQDMIDAQKLLGVDMTTGHWEFTYGAARVEEVLRRDYKDRIEFLAQNVNDNAWEDLIFKPYAMRDVNDVPVAVIGQAFPYTPIANPRHLIPRWAFGINEEHLQSMIDEVRSRGAQVVVLLSHNGMDVDLKLAGRVRGLDAILGGHTHDAVPAPVIVSNPGGKTLVINSGSHGKFLSVLDLQVRAGKIADYRYRLLPIFADLLPADESMTSHIEKSRAPFRAKLQTPIAVTESLLYRRGNFGGTFDRIIIDAMLAVFDAEIALSPGFRWGGALLPGDTITLEHLMDQTAITYPGAFVSRNSGAEIKTILEDVADNLFHPDPYYQQGGDMVRVGGLAYALDVNGDYGRRILDVTVRGKPLDARKRYKVARWASVQPPIQGERPIWDVVTDYLRAHKAVHVESAYTPVLRGTDGNPGLGR